MSKFYGESRRIGLCIKKNGISTGPAGIALEMHGVWTSVIGVRSTVSLPVIIRAACEKLLQRVYAKQLTLIGAPKFTNVYV